MYHIEFPSSQSKIVHPIFCTLDMTCVCFSAFILTYCNYIENAFFVGGGGWLNNQHTKLIKTIVLNSV